MKKIQLYLLLGVVIFATGCPSEPSKNLSDKKAIAAHINNRVNEYLGARQSSYYAALSANDKKAERDDAIEDVLAMIDSNYQDYINRLETRRSTTDFIADVIDLGTGAATGIAKGERPNQILGIALTAFRGGRKSIELNFYKEQTTPILISKMDGNRAKVYAEILQKKTRPVTEYSLSDAIRDMVAYYNAGTLVRAFTELAKDTSAQTLQAEKRVLQLKSINPSDIVNFTPEVTAASNQFGEDRAALVKTFRDGTTEQQKAATAKLRNIYLALAKGDKSADFKAILDQIKQENAELKADMTTLEGADAASNGVAGMNILRILSAVFSKIDLEKQANLATEFQTIVHNGLTS
jgi:hypothetical protein